MRTNILTPEWEEGHAAALRGDDVDESNPYAGDDGMEYAIGHSCGRHDLEMSCERISRQLPSMQECARRIGEPLIRWPGNCFAIASALVDERVIPGRSVYGAYHGPIAPTSMFAKRSALTVNHGWILTPGGFVVDPTRWVFEAKPPAFHVTPAFDPFYDEGASLRARAFRLPFPSEGKPEFPPCPEAKALLQQQRLQCPRLLSAPQVCWIANTPVSDLGALAKPIYQWLDHNDLGGFIPQDNRAAVENPRPAINLNWSMR